jgi:hypothetical protein
MNDHSFIEVLESLCAGSRVNAILDNPFEEGPDEG